LSSFTHSHSVPKPYGFLSSAENLLRNVCVFVVHTMEVNGLHIKHSSKCLLEQVIELWDIMGASK